MSHFITLVIVPGDTPMNRIEQKVATLLEPYSEYNPRNTHVKWDWWVIGGRWDGWIFGPEQEKASRDKDHGMNLDDKHRTLKNNCRPVSEIPPNALHYIPFAILTPDGEWTDWDEISATNEKAPKAWHETVKAVLEKYLKHLAVAVDCHT